ncbi:MAG: hypothetical protein IKX24_04305 [Prevotella sp.]|nr:hypothetical protein [Prevotella sp.]
MEKIIKDYSKPVIKVNDYISRHRLMAGWELGEGTTDEQLGHDPVEPGPVDPLDPQHRNGVRNNVWSE